MSDLEREDDLLDATLARLRRRVAEREAAGEYPPGLLEDLDAHYLRLVPARGGGPGALDAALARLDRAADIGRHRIYTDSRLPLGSAVHRTVGKVTVRQTNGVLEQLAEFAAVVRDLLHAVVDTLPEQDMAALSGRVDYLLDRIAAYERAPAGSDAPVRELSARLDRVEAALRMRDASTHFSHAAFEAARAAADECAETLHGLLRSTPWTGPVLVLAAGRGDVVRLLRDGGVEASGVEANPELAGAAAAAGLPVSVADPVDHLDSLPESSLAGVVAAREVEALPPRRLAVLVERSARVLRPDGHLVVSASPRPVPSTGTDWVAGVPASFVRFLLEQASFHSVSVRCCARRDDGDLAEAQGTGASSAEALRRLHDRVLALEAETAPYVVVAAR